MEYNDFDDILIDLKTGRWNLFHVFTYSLSLFIIPHLVIGGVFLAPNTRPVCDIPKFIENSTNITVTECSYAYNVSVNSTVNSMSENAMSNPENGEGMEKEMECSKWIFDQEPGNTLTSEFSLVCDRSYLRPSYQSAILFGTMMGAPINGFLSDSFGRKKLHIFGLSCITLLTLASTFLASFSIILAARWLTGLLIPTVTHTGMVLCMELLEPKYRPSVVLLFTVPWALGMMWMGTLAYFIRDWRWLLRAALIPCVINWPLVWFFDESARWLIVRGSLNRAQKILRKAFRQNKTDWPTENRLEIGINNIFQMSVKEKESTSNDDTFLMKIQMLFEKGTMLFRTPETRRRTFLQYFMHFCGSMVYFGLTLNAANFHFNPYLYMIVTAAIEIPSYILSVPIVNKLGRIKPLIVSQLIVGVSILILAFVAIDTDWLRMTLSLIGKFAISTSTNIIFLQDSELLPTEVKVQIYGTCLAMSRIGAILAAYVTDLGGDALSWLPSALFGSISLFSAGVAWFIPETLDHHIYNTVLQLEEDTWQKKNRNNVFKELETIKAEDSTLRTEEHLLSED